MKPSRERDSELITRGEVNKLLAQQEEAILRRIGGVNGVPDCAYSPIRFPNDSDPARSRPSRIAVSAAIALVVAGFFLYCTWPGLFIGFDNDDVTNLYRSWQEPLSRLFTANLVPFTTVYRPAGAVYYRLCYALFGWNPAAFRIVTYGVFLTNLLLIYLLAKRLSRSMEVGILSAFLYTFHGRLRALYMSNGAVYDVLCCMLTLLTLIYYLGIRRTEKARPWHYIALTILFIAALSAKEMAAVVPLLLVLIEWLDHPPNSWRAVRLAGWIRRYTLFAAFLLAFAVLAFWGKQSAGSIFHEHPLYKPSYTVKRYFENERLMLGELFYRGDKVVNTTGVVAFYCVLFGLAAVARRKHIWFSAWLFFFAQLPVIFIPYRGFFVMYLPLAGLAIYLASLLVAAREWIVTRAFKSEPLEPRVWNLDNMLAVALLMVVIPLGRNRDEATMLTIQDPSMKYIRATYEDIVAMNEPLPKGARVLLLQCRYPDDNWGPLMMMRLLYQDRTLSVDRPAMMNARPDDETMLRYDRVIDFNGSGLEVIRRKKGIEASSESNVRSISN